MKVSILLTTAIRVDFEMNAQIVINLEGDIVHRDQTGGNFLFADDVMQIRSRVRFAGAAFTVHIDGLHVQFVLGASQFQLTFTHKSDTETLK